MRVSSIDNEPRDPLSSVMVLPGPDVSPAQVKVAVKKRVLEELLGRPALRAVELEAALHEINRKVDLGPVVPQLVGCNRGWDRPIRLGRVVHDYGRAERLDERVQALVPRVLKFGDVGLEGAVCGKW